MVEAKEAWQAFKGTEPVRYWVGVRSYTVEPIAKGADQAKRRTMKAGRMRSVFRLRRHAFQCDWSDDAGRIPVDSNHVGLFSNHTAWQLIKSRGGAR